MTLDKFVELFSTKMNIGPMFLKDEQNDLRQWQYKLLNQLNLTLGTCDIWG